MIVDIDMRLPLSKNIQKGNNKINAVGDEDSLKASKDFRLCVEASSNLRLSVSHRNQLVCLTLIAVGALFSIIVIAQQLISRHIGLNNQLSSRVEIISDKLRNPRNLRQMLPIIETDSVTYWWSSDVESLMPKITSDNILAMNLQLLRSTPILIIYRPDETNCGDGHKKLFIRMADGSEACARYQTFLPDILTFYLARLLGTTDSPTIVLSKMSSKQWHTVNASIFEAGLSPSVITALERGLPPPELTTTTNIPVFEDKPKGDFDSLKRIESYQQLISLVQFNDLRILNHIISHSGDLTGSETQDLHDADNLRKNTLTNALINAHKDSMQPQFNRMHMSSKYLHTTMMQLGCIFRRSTIQRIIQLLDHPNPFQFLLKIVKKNEPLFDSINIPPITAQRFKQRLHSVIDWVKICSKKDTYLNEGYHQDDKLSDSSGIHKK